MNAGPSADEPLACHVRRVNLRSRVLWAALPTILACEDEGPAFLSLSELCRRHAENVCAARETCCEQVPPRSACEASERDSCVVLRENLEKEGAVDYDAAKASRVLSEEQQALEACGVPFSIGRFFSGTAALGDGCQRHAQCASDSCDPEQAVCAVRGDLLLCAPSESAEQARR